MKTFQDIAISHLQKDDRYQRDLDKDRAKSIGDKFDEHLFGVPIVSQRAADVFFVLDGQHRIEARRLTGYKGKIHCEVLEGLSLAEEAETFVRVNNGRSPIKAFDAYKAKLVARDPATTATDKIVRSYGLRVVKGTIKAGGGIRAVGQLEKAYSRNVLPQVLGTLTGWAGEPVDQAFVDKECLSVMIAFFGAHPKAHIGDIVVKLKTINPVKLLSRINIKKETLRSTFGEASVLVLCEMYNYRRKSGVLK